MKGVWYLNIHIFASLLAVTLGCISAALVGIKARHSPSSRPFMILMFSGGVWCLYPTVTSLPLSEDTLFKLARTAYMASGFTITGFLHLAFAISEDERHAWRYGWLQVCYAFAILLTVLVWSPLFIVGLIRYAPFFVPVPGPLYHLLVFFYFIAAGYGILVTIRGVRRAAGAKKNKLRYFLVASGILSLTPLLHFGGVYLRWEPIPHDFLVPVFSAIVALAILRHQLLDIRIVVNKALVYSALITCMTACYLVMVLMTERWFQGFFGYRSLAGSIIAAFAIAIFFDPLRNRIQALVDRAIFAATPAELAAQREQLLAEVRKSEQMKAVGTLAAGLAHEIKNPLTSIKTFTEHLEHRYNDPEFRVKFQRIVGGETDRINLIVQQLLEFAKPVPPKLRPLHIPSLLDDTLDLLGNDLIKHRVEVVKDYRKHGLVLGDPQQLRQVFLNLFLNSLQAMNGNGRLTITSAAKSGELTVSIADNGRGIDPKSLSRVFEPFYTTKSTGTGLGLAVVHSIVREHKGRIAVTSQLRQGTIITLCLPLCSH